MNGNLEIVNTGYEFVFKEYIFWELNKCHYSHLLLETSSLQKWFVLYQNCGENQRGNGADVNFLKPAINFSIFTKCIYSFFCIDFSNSVQSVSFHLAEQFN